MGWAIAGEYSLESLTDLALCPASYKHVQRKQRERIQQGAGARGERATNDFNDAARWDPLR